MRRCQSSGHLAQELSFLIEVQIRREAIQGKTLDQLHDDRGRARVIEHGEDRHDCWVGQRGGLSRFVQQSASDFLAGLRPEDFQRHKPVQLLVQRSINDAQAAFAHLVFDSIARNFRHGNASLVLDWTGALSLRTRRPASIRSRASRRTGSASPRHRRRLRSCGSALSLRKKSAACAAAAAEAAPSVAWRLRRAGGIGWRRG